MDRYLKRPIMERKQIMGSHSNDDHGNPEMNAAIRAMFEDKAAQLTERRMNTYTAGTEEERALWAELSNGVMITQMPKDPLAVRISIGKAYDIDEDGSTYLSFRGKPSEVIELLEQALRAVKHSLVGDPNAKI